MTFASSVVRGIVRRFQSSPFRSLCIILTYVLVIGANTIIFTVVDQTLLRAAPYNKPEQLVEIRQYSRTGSSSTFDLSIASLVEWRTHSEVFQAVEGYSSGSFEVASETGPIRLTGAYVTAGLSSMLGVYPRLGVPNDGHQGHVVILAEQLWRTHFGADPQIIGKVIAIDDVPHRVVAVMPRRFGIPSTTEQVWLPVAVESKAAQGLSFWAIGRLRGGLSVDLAQALVRTAGDALEKAHPTAEGWTIGLEPKRIARIDSTAKTALLWTLTALALLLCIGCANVATLMLSEAGGRSSEMAIRSTLGATRFTLIRSVVLETMAFAVIGGGLGVLIAKGGLWVLVPLAPNDLSFARATTLELDIRVLIFTGVIVTVVGVLAGLPQAFSASRPDLASLLRRNASTATRGTALRTRTLIVASTVLAVGLSMCAALLGRTLFALRHTDPGFDPRGVLVLELWLPSDRYPSAASRYVFTQALTNQIAALPRVLSVALTDGVPPNPGGLATARLDSVDHAPGTDHASVIAVSHVDGSFFRTLRIQFLTGREFNSNDGDDVVIVSERLALRLGLGPAAVNRLARIPSGAPERLIIGVVHDVRARGPSAVTYEMYLPWPRPTAVGPPASGMRRSYSTRRFVIRTSDERAVVAAIPSTLRTLDDKQAIGRLRQLQDVYAEATDMQQFVAILSGCVAVIALVLAFSGILGSLLEVVLRRTKEIGIRRALGAPSLHIYRIIVYREMVLALIGIVIGIGIGSTVASRFLDSILFGINAHDKLTIVSVVMTATSATLIACALPVRLALSVEPSTTLRSE